MKLRLFAKMVLCILLPTILGFCIFSVSVDYLARQILSKQITSTMNLLVSGQAEQLRNIAGVIGDISKSTATAERGRDLLRAVHLGQSAQIEAALPNAQRVLGEIKDNFEWVTDCGYVDATGKVIAHTVQGFAGTLVADRSYFKDAMQGRMGTATVLSRATKDVRAIMAYPVQENGKTLGVAYLTMSLGQISKMTTDNVKVGNTGIAFVFDNKGIRIMDPRPDRVGGDEIKTPWVRRVVESAQSGNFSFTRADGVAGLVFFAKVPAMGWTVAMAVDESEAYTSLKDMTQIILSMGLGASVLVGLIIFFFSRQLTSTLRGGAQFTAFVAEGNLVLSPDQRVLLDRDCSRGDEIGDLAKGVRCLVENLGKMVHEAEEKSRMADKASTEAHAARQAAEDAMRRADEAQRQGMLDAAQRLEGAVQIISSASTQLSAQITQSERGSAEQASRVTETATAMEEMNCTVLEVARNASAASEASASTRTRAENGAGVVKKAVSSIQQVQSQSIALKEDMAELGQSAQAISQIMGVISDIADQTNLLALNAAIEAARAGEAGRGFAVVADEVRKLAEKTMQSTTDVGNAIKAIQLSADRSMHQVDEAVKTIEEATSLAAQSGEALGEIVGMVDSTADQVRAIATAAEEQSSSSEEINQSIAQVNTIATETARAMQEAAGAVSDLAGQAQVLQGLIDDMKR